MKPRDISIDKPFFNTFGQCEMEGAARLIVALLRLGNEWRDFTQDELLEFARSIDNVGNVQGWVIASRRMRVTEYDAECVSELISHGWVQQLDGNKLSVTLGFIERLMERERSRCASDAKDPVW